MAVAFPPHVVLRLSLPHSFTCFCQISYSSLSQALFHPLTLVNVSFFFQISFFNACSSVLPSLEVSNPLLSFYWLLQYIPIIFTVFLPYSASYRLFYTSQTSPASLLHPYPSTPSPLLPAFILSWFCILMPSSVENYSADSVLNLVNPWGHRSASQTIFKAELRGQDRSPRALVCCIRESTLKERSKAESHKDSPDPPVFNVLIQVKSKTISHLGDNSSWWQEHKGSNKHVTFFLMEKRICWWQADLFMLEERTRINSAEVKDWVMSDHCLLGSVPHATVTGGPAWLSYTNPCDHLLKKKKQQTKKGCAMEAENCLTRSVLSLRRAEAVSYGEEKHFFWTLYFSGG